MHVELGLGQPGQEIAGYCGIGARPRPPSRASHPNDAAGGYSSVGVERETTAVRQSHAGLAKVGTERRIGGGHRVSDRGASGYREKPLVHENWNGAGHGLTGTSRRSPETLTG